MAEDGERVAILGAGAWGTALAIHLARIDTCGSVTLWARDGAQTRDMAVRRENVRYLPGAALPESIAVVADLAVATAQATLLIVATPVAALCDLASTLRGLAARDSATARADDAIPALFWVCKGFVASPDDPGIALAHTVVAPAWPSAVGVISGPSFADEVARGLPTAVSVAATFPEAAERVSRVIRGGAFRAYVSDDLAGVEAAGAVKNVLAIAAGASDGLGFGNNARAALITRGLAECGRLCEALGGRRETLMGLAGLGDLVLTCTGDLSRNRRVGLALGRGEALPSIVAGLHHVAEGVFAARAVRALAAALRLDMPICDAVYRVLYEDLPPRRAVEALLAREPGREFG